jgi:hypothetical protein
MNEHKRQKILLGILIFFSLLYLLNPLSKEAEKELSRRSDAQNAMGSAELASQGIPNKGPAAKKQEPQNKPVTLPQTSPAKPLSLEELQKKYGHPFTVARTTAGQPFRLTGKIDREPAMTNEESLSNVLASVSNILSVDHLDQLKNATSQGQPLGTTTNFQQEFDGIPVDGALVRVHQDKNGDVFMINSSYIPGVAGINTDPSVTKTEASQFASSEATKLDPAARVPDVADPVLVIHKFQSGSIDLSWKVVISQPWLGASHGVGTYFIDAHQISIFERIENAVQ